MLQCYLYERKNVLRYLILILQMYHLQILTIILEGKKRNLLLLSQCAQKKEFIAFISMGKKRNLLLLSQYEYEKEDKLPFLDILVMKKKSGTLATKIYRKETHTNRYLNYESCHSQQQKQGIIISLLNRLAKLITDSKDFNEEKEMLRRTLEDNNYPN